MRACTYLVRPEAKRSCLVREAAAAAEEALVAAQDSGNTGAFPYNP